MGIIRAVLLRIAFGSQAKAINYPCLIAALPVEILAYIFEIGRPAWPNWPLMVDTYPLAIASVCRYWRDVAINITPIIWSNVAVHAYHSLMLPSLYMQRSGASLLDIYFDAMPPTPNVDRNYHALTDFVLEPPEAPPSDGAALGRALELILNHSHRWRDLNFFCGEEESTIVLSSLHSIKAPNLRALESSSYTETPFPVILMGGAPNPSSSSISPGLDNCASLSSVSKITLHPTATPMSYAQLSTFLASFPSLQQLILVGIHLHESVSIEDNPILVPTLTALELDGSTSTTLLFLLIQSPSLRVLKLSNLSIRQWENVLNHIAALNEVRPSIETLIVSNCHMRTYIPLPSFPSCFPNVKHLLLDNSSTTCFLNPLLEEQDVYWPALTTLTRSGSLNWDAQPLLEYREKQRHPLEVVQLPDKPKWVVGGTDVLEWERYFYARRQLDISNFL